MFVKMTNEFCRKFTHPTCQTDRPLIKHSRYTSQISDENEGGNYLPEITVLGLKEEEETEEEVQHAIPPSVSSANVIASHSTHMHGGGRKEGNWRRLWKLADGAKKMQPTTDDPDRSLALRKSSACPTRLICTYAKRQNHLGSG